MLSINFKYNIKDIEKLYPDYIKGLKTGITQAMLYAETKAKQRFGSVTTADRVKAVTGHFRRSIKALPVRKSVSGMSSGLNASVVYAATHEYGATIRAKSGKYLRFKIGNQWVSKKQVKIPARPMVGPGITENLDRIQEMIVNSVVMEMNR